MFTVIVDTARLRSRTRTQVFVLRHIVFNLPCLQQRDRACRYMKVKITKEEKHTQQIVKKK